MTTALAVHIADAINDPTMLREIIACASYDIVAGRWRLGGPADPRRLVDDFRIDLIPALVERVDYERLVEFGELVHIGLMTGRLDPESRTMQVVRETFARLKPEQVRDVNITLILAAMGAIKSTGSSSEIFDELKRTLHGTYPILAD